MDFHEMLELTARLDAAADAARDESNRWAAQRHGEDMADEWDGVADMFREASSLAERAAGRAAGLR